MKSLEERLEERKAEYEKLVESENLVQTYLDKLTNLIPESTNILANIYKSNCFIYLSFDDVEEFEENYITKLSDEFNISWKRYINSDEIRHESDFAIEDNNYTIYIIARSKPTNSCRITKVATGKVVKQSRYIDFLEAEYEYLVECVEELDD